MRNLRVYSLKTNRIGLGTRLLCILLLPSLFTACTTTPAPILTGCQVDEDLIRELEFPARNPASMPTNGNAQDDLVHLRREIKRDNERKRELREQLKRADGHD